MSARDEAPGGLPPDGEQAPSGMPPGAEEAPPLGVPVDADDDRDGEAELPGIPTEDSPPSTG